MGLFSFKSKISGYEWWVKHSLLDQEVAGTNIWNFISKSNFDSLEGENSISYDKFSTELIKIRFEIVLLAHQFIGQKEEVYSFHEGLQLFCKSCNKEYLWDGLAKYNLINKKFATFWNNPDLIKMEDQEIESLVSKFKYQNEKLGIDNMISNRKGLDQLHKAGYFLGSFALSACEVIPIDILNRIKFEVIITGYYKGAVELLRKQNIVRSK